MKIVAILVLLVVVIFLFRSSRSSPRPAGGSGKSTKNAKAVRAANTAALGTSAYRAVSVKCGSGACAQAKALGSQRFLPGELTKLPLANCSAVDCKCKFVHHADRRDSQEDKRAPTALRSELYTAAGKPERRGSAGRRKSDYK